MKRSILTGLLPLLALAAAGCSSGNGGTIDALTDPDAVEEAETGCTTDTECNDDVDCTIDTCGFGGICSHTPVNSECGPGQECDEEEGCVDIGCTADPDCNDDIGCTEDLCGAGGVCSNVPRDDLCEADQTCSPTSGCTSPCLVDEDCSNGVFCDGAEDCEPEFGCLPPAAPEDCDDNDDCTQDDCDAELDRCVNTCVPSATCECPFDPNDAYNACYTIAPAVTQRCAFGRVNYNISQICFSISGPALEATVGPLFHGTSNVFTQVPAPTGRDFSVGQVISGGCEEHYTVTGSFTTTPTTFEGTWTTDFVDFDGYSCSVSGCSDMSREITGTRE